jgi:AdoMet-dependent heme synthase
MITKLCAASLVKRGVYNYLFKRPFGVSFEVTHNCNAKCKHCHLGAKVSENRASPEKLGEICRQLKPVLAQLSGGEPLLRNDLEKIVKNFKRPNRAPYIDITTNGILLTKERYNKLLDAGVDQIGLSLDYPDERHDTFRGVPGLFNRIENLINSLSSNGQIAISFICTIQSDNFRDLDKMVELAQKWNVKVNFSTYTWLRTNDKGYLVSKEDIPELRKIVNDVINLKRKYNNVLTSEYLFNKMIEFFENESMPNCRTGERFFNVNPDGSISPCGLRIKNYKSQQELRDKFKTEINCESCYTSIRGNTEKPFWYLLKDNFELIKNY